MHTSRALRTGVCALGVALGLTACKDFLSGDKLTNNPNHPSIANANQLFVGVQVQTFANYTGRYPMSLLPLYVRQFTGTARQWKGYASYSDGGPTENTADALFIDTYGQGGLVDIRAIEDASRAAGNDRFLGIAQVYEALRMGDATSLFGDIPYSEALGVKATPKLDTQAEVLAHVQELLDSAITNLSSGKGAGPSAVDFVYGNDPDKWIKAAHTLKARYYMHASASAPDSSSIFQKVISEAQQGLTESSDDWVVNFTNNAGETNLWGMFFIGRAGDIEPDQFFIDQLTQRGDNTLLSAYFIPKAGCGFAGARPDADNACASEFNIDPTTPMAVLTSTENQMLLAEAQFRSGQSGAALGTLNAYRQSVGEATVNPSGIGILTAILSEKYFHLFLNPEVFFDYQRNCFPNFDIPYADATHHYVPARLPYGYTERITNPNVGDFPSATNNDFLNPLFPTRQLDVTGASCFGQKGRPTG